MVKIVRFSLYGNYRMTWNVAACGAARVGLWQFLRRNDNWVNQGVAI